MQSFEGIERLRKQFAWNPSVGQCAERKPRDNTDMARLSYASSNGADLPCRDDSVALPFGIAKVALDQALAN